MITFVHMIFGLALCYLLGFPLLFGLIGAALPDIDILWAEDATVHREFFHTPFVGIILAAIIFFVLEKVKKGEGNYNRVRAFAFLLGWLSHLFGDTLTRFGVMLLYPMDNIYYTADLCKSSDIFYNLLFILASIAIIIIKIVYDARVGMKKYKMEDWKKFLAVCIIMLLVLVPTTKPRTYLESDRNPNIAYLVKNSQSHEGNYLTISGTISRTEQDYVAKSGNVYNQFYVSDETGEILVFAESPLGKNFKPGDKVKVSGKFTAKYGKPEIQVFESYGKIERTG